MLTSDLNLSKNCKRIEILKCVLKNVQTNKQTSRSKMIKERTAHSSSTDKRTHNMENT